MMKRYAFTMLELVFVIVIMGIIGKFGVEFLAQAYNTFIYAKINNQLQADSTHAVDFIAKRLESRIPPSTIKRKLPYNTVFEGATENVPDPDSYDFLEWIAYDVDGFRSQNDAKIWSGIIDLDTAKTTSLKLFSPDSNMTAIDNHIKALSNNASDITRAALFFPSSNYNINAFGWDGGTALTDQNRSMHPIIAGGTNEFAPSTTHGTNFDGATIYNRYMLAWTAYAIKHEDGNLTLYYDYQPWHGENYLTHGTPTLLMQNVDTFRVKGTGELFSIQVCVDSNLTTEDHSICKEKTIF